MAGIEALEEDIDIEFLREDIAELIGDCREGVDRIKKTSMDMKDFAHRGEDRMVATRTSAAESNQPST